MRALHCPRCGDAIEEDGGTFGCRRGQMELSRRMHDDLVACFLQRSRVPDETPLKFAVGGRWHCPACGGGITEVSPGHLPCSDCGLALNEFVVALVELHEHERVGSGTEVLSTAEAARIARSWIAVQRNWWATTAIRELVVQDPASALAAFDEVVAQADAEEVLGDLGAGPLEDFVRAHGPRFIDELEERARDARWRAALSSVRLADGDDDVTSRLERLGCTQLRNRR